ncbi:MAG: hypothetical protein GY795_10920 [Desulfobacterales bacterium]|nr:hypothetical protein [Desulfobacterales bacterium]
MIDHNSAEHEKKLRLEIEVKLILPENIFSQVKHRKGIKKKDIEQIYLTPDLVGQFSKELSLPKDVIFKEWRIRRTDHKYSFTAKSKAGKKGIQRTEYQTGISDSLFSAIKNLAYSKGNMCQVQKTRYSFLADFAGEQVSVEIDDYHATGKGLNISDSEIAGAFAAPGTTLDGVITWNPVVLQIEKTMKAKRIFDSHTLEREIADMLVIRRGVLKNHPRFAHALLKTWFDIMALMKGSERNNTMDMLGKLSGADRENYEEQLRTTLLTDTPAKALQAIKDKGMEKTMEYVHAFAERHKLMISPPPKPWVSYPGNENKALLHFNDQPLALFSETPSK